MKKILFFSLIFLFNILLYSSENLTNSQLKILTPEEKEWFSRNPESLPHWMTEEEKLRIDEIGKDFEETDPPPLPVRQPAEFEPMEGVLIRYPLGISTSIIAEMAEDVIVYCVVTSSQQSSAYNTFSNAGVNMDNVQFVNCQTDTYWIRDYGPWFIFNGENQPGIVDFVYNRPRPYDDAVPGHVGNYFGIDVYAMDIVHTGGNYMTDGQGISVSTELVWQENTDLSHTEIDSIMNEYLGINTYHVVPDALGEYIKHIDCWAKYLAPDIVMIIEVSPSHSHYDEIEAAVEYFENKLSCYGTPYHIERVYTHLYEPYINSLILNDKVFVPINGSQWDAGAIASYQEALPGYEVLGFTGSWANTDALHCRTMGVTDRGMLYIKHTPLQDTLDAEIEHPVQAIITPLSGESLIEDSLIVYWKTSIDDDFYPVQMQPIFGNLYSGYIPAQSSGTTVQYYIHAADSSGRSENSPYIGAPMAYSFYVEDITGLDDQNALQYKPILYQNYPNPFSSSTTISFLLHRPIESMVGKKIELGIYNIKGQLVKRLGFRISDFGYGEAVWDGKDNNGIPLGSGIYLYQLSTKGGSSSGGKMDNKIIATKRCLLLKQQ